MAKKGKIGILGFTIPDVLMKKIIRTDSGMPIQTHKFAWNVVDSLRGNASEVVLFSSLPISNYPGNKKIFVKHAKIFHEGIDVFLLPFMNFLVLKHFSRAYACFKIISPFLKSKQVETLMVHGVHSPYLLFCFFANIFYKTNYVVFITDPPGVLNNSDSILVRFLKKIDVVLIKFFLKRAAGVLVLTKKLAEVYAPGKKFLLMEGFCDERKCLAESLENPKFNIVYAGGLSSAYGVDRLLQAFNCIKNDALELNIYGKGHLENFITDNAKKDGRVKFHGFLDPESMRHALAKADLFVNPRLKDDFVENFSFPSKIMEYMSYGKPVLTTRLNGIPEEYDEFLYYFIGDSVSEIKEGIEKFLLLPKLKISDRVDAAKNFVLRKKNPKNQGRRISNFLHQINCYE